MNYDNWKQQAPPYPTQMHYDRALIFELDEIPAEDAALLWDKFLEKVNTAPFSASRPQMEVTKTGTNEEGEHFVSVDFTVNVAVNYANEDDIQDEERAVLYHFYPDFEEGELI